MKRRTIIQVPAAAAALVVVLPAIAQTQQADKVRRIGWLASTGGVPDAFRDSLRQSGYIEGRNLVIEFRSAEGKLDRLPELAAEMVRLKVDVIVAFGSLAAQPAKAATSTIPIVMFSGDPISTGLIASLARPGGNVTGIASFSVETAGKRLELLKSMVPGMTRVAVLWDRDSAVKAQEYKDTVLAAKILHIELKSVELRAPTPDIEAAINAAVAWRARALFVLGNTLTRSYVKVIAELANKHRLASMYDARDYVAAGGLAAYGHSFDDIFRGAASYVVKILKGARPADLPVEQPTRFDFVVNAKTAKALGLVIPPKVLLQVTETIE